ncbi:MAG: hypothetical protein A2418_02355 [Candidatus Brennerbacteria bacterium RIFOXYC1_FULL_41_11]|uniref:Dockerin domain-containing protein n=1 Tax=Candidatus Brennerbacteria bacterium RIFOXYD1_FULL_41_16 TaxID=1797529 RepID=A0A1G1XJG9_9BACT|nr:MAG: hypothetical protein UU61_C0006G0002 [Parcubacteria group bacterium GW2011_GWB1_41_4]OGY38743.1 MAG: hypothetical protein A2391_02110 [Candidatus Brennerbacteria bacterium RIFOXYB1_FULL_41_13]OGY39026.1 MAG: hypothetical protein A2418_02355 [Candidatus Brennerbacteria bacterium RIFOXYC1_FULL_41_11]OGY40179.1 MAG: hypothetical protein A2570_02735 [Candidatus Brennerbacteria bacterium RIFOXYD1_FULL_41_16]
MKKLLPTLAFVFLSFFSISFLKIDQLLINYFVNRADAVEVTAIVGSPSPSMSVSPTPSPTPSQGGGGGGGGGGMILPPTQATVVFSGKAYPGSNVVLLKDAQVATTVKAGQDANFSVTLSGISGGSYIFSLYGENSRGNRSSLLTFPVSIVSGATTLVSGIFISPTIAVDKSEVKRGDNIVVFGQSFPKSEITVSVSSEEENFFKIISDQAGAYLLNLDSSILEVGDHFTKSKSAISGEISVFGKSVSFKVGTKNVLAVQETLACHRRSDVNGDCRVNLTDFSIVAYWYKRALTSAVKNGVDFNADGKVTLVDFSIMAYYWTG